VEATKLQITIKTPINPTEDKGKVARCLQKILDRPQIEEEGNYLVVNSSDQKVLASIRAKLREQRIIDSARKIILRNFRREVDYVEFYINKQAAFAGKINFVTNPDQEDYLGPITVTITGDEIQKVIDWLTWTSSESEE
jgi:predicted RNA binding protein with dsRBD fold (UPF0201 family)